MRYLTLSDSQRQKIEYGCPGPEGGGQRVAVFQSSGDRCWQWLQSNANVFNVTESHTLQWSKWLKKFFWYVCFAII